MFFFINLGIVEYTLEGDSIYCGRALDHQHHIVKQEVDSPFDSVIDCVNNIVIYLDGPWVARLVDNCFLIKCVFVHSKQKTFEINGIKVEL